MRNGALDEWLSQWSAKPCTAVRIRQAPQNEFSNFTGLLADTVLKMVGYVVEFDIIQR